MKTNSCGGNSSKPVSADMPSFKVIGDPAPDVGSDAGFGCLIGWELYKGACGPVGQVVMAAVNLAMEVEHKAEQWWKRNGKYVSGAFAVIGFGVCVFASIGACLEVGFAALVVDTAGNTLMYDAGDMSGSAVLLNIAIDAAGIAVDGVAAAAKGFKDGKIADELLTVRNEKIAEAFGRAEVLKRYFPKWRIVERVVDFAATKGAAAADKEYATAMRTGVFVAKWKAAGKQALVAVSGARCLVVDSAPGLVKSVVGCG